MNPTERRAQKRAHVEAHRAQTVCARCGGQPIEWHHDDHPAEPRRRVSSMVHDQRTLAAIEAEIARCTPLCRSCHMAEDGRKEALIAQNQARPRRAVEQDCQGCGRPVVRVTPGYCDTCLKRRLRGSTTTRRFRLGQTADQYPRNRGNSQDYEPN